jgi:hypothetical protein
MSFVADDIAGFGGLLATREFRFAFELNDFPLEGVASLAQAGAPWTKASEAQWLDAQAQGLVGAMASFALTSGDLSTGSPEHRFTILPVLAPQHAL